ncbi:MAG TPA: beta-ketoacyl synthase N-terminal-like domain-containing protein, partial [Gemmatimonadota bacterium]|nr:beta-ketoacyl synthase N-terminal-like domain-containing protein [Gemmatimonadota bacterium]
MARPSAPEIAIVGMAGVFPGAPDLDGYRRAIESGADAIQEVPPARWSDLPFDPADSGSIDQMPCRRGGFIDDFAEFDALRWGMMPATVEAVEPDQLLALETAARALADAGRSEDFPRERTAVILGRGGYVSPGQVRLLQAVRTARELGESVRGLVPQASDEEVGRARREYRAQVQNLGPDAMIGLVPNLAASRIANRLDIRGPAYTIDAACASSLIAVDRAAADLAAGRCDLALAGGVHVAQDLVFWVVFAQMGALSRRQEIRPFDRAADGLLIGEGVGIVVLKRLEDARRDGDRIYAVVRGTGTSSDGRGTSLMNPRVESQVLAIERAWQVAGLDPRDPGAVGLIEAHGTATPVGDRAEVEALRRVFGPPTNGRRAILGSVKSMIGHTMPAAGAAGLIKAALAIHHRILPPTLHCEDPLPELERTRFRTLAAAEPWEGPGPIRAGVNAFGFGGINAHVLLESDDAAPAARGRRAAETAGEAVLIAAATPEELLRRLDEGPWTPGDGPVRLALLDPSPEAIDEAREVVRSGRPWHDRTGRLLFTPRGLLADGAGIAFLYPGVDAGPPEDLAEVARRFGREAEVAAARSDLEGAAAGIVRGSLLLTRILEEDLGIVPRALVGHSVGEWSAMVAAGAIPLEAVDELVAMAEPGRFEFPDVEFLMAAVDGERATGLLAGVEDVHLALDNCPHQSILCGPGPAIEAAVSRLAGAGVLFHRLSFQSGFHTPHLRGRALEQVEALVAGVEFRPPERPLWSATTAAPFPVEPGAMRRRVVEHLLRPVRFRETVLRLHAEGVRGFLQVGSGSLAGFVDDTLRELPHRSLRASARGRPGLEQLRRTVAMLWVEGAGVRYRRLLRPRPGPAAWSGRPVRVSLGAPLVTLEAGNGQPRNGVERRDDVADDPVLAEFRRLSRAIEDAHREIEGALRSRPRESPAAPPAPATDAPAAPATPILRKRVTLSLETCPWLVDHSFYSLPPDWPDPRDGYPLAPLTMSISMMMDAAREAAPGLRAVGVESVRARRWVAVDEPVEIEIRAEPDGAGRVRVAIGDYTDAVVRMAPDYPPPPPVDSATLEGERPIEMTPEEMYAQRLMFHGPRYQAVTGLHAISREGIRGEVTSLEAPGSLLDGAGQVMGYWIRAHTTRDRVGVPILVDRIDFHGPDPAPGERFDCVVRIGHFGEWQVKGDIELSRAGQVWARIEGWADRRMRSDERMWHVIQFAERNPLALPVPGAPGLWWLPDPFEKMSTRDYFARRYLTRSERGIYESLPPRPRNEWLAERIALKDAVRGLLRSEGRESVWPIEVEVLPGSAHAPEIRCRHADDLRGSVARDGAAAAALVARGADVGVALLPVGSGEDAAPTHTSRGTSPEADGGEGRTRRWAARQAAA